MQTKNSLKLKLNILKKIHPNGVFGSICKSNLRTTEILEGIMKSAEAHYKTFNGIKVLS